jgi:predicted O-methyltransferase YrrM
MAVATTVYLNPTAAPTNVTGQNQNTVVVTAFPATTGDTVQITTAFGLSTTELAAGWPTITIEALDLNAAGANWSIASLDANYVGLIKNNTTASSSTTAQIRVKVQRPHSITR